MAVLIKYHNIIIPIERLKEITTISKFLKHLKKEKINNTWQDEHLLVIGGIMGPYDVKTIAEKLEVLGLNLYKDNSYFKSFDDICIIDFVNGPTRKCSWLEYKLNPWDISYAWLKGKEIGNIIKPSNI
jgi:hypothetical protein